MRKYVLERARLGNHSIKRLRVFINASSSLGRGYEQGQVIPVDTLTGWPEEDRDGNVKEGSWTSGISQDRSLKLSSCKHVLPFKKR